MKGALGIQSEYSLLKSTIPLKTLFTETVKAGYGFFALADDNTLYAAYKFYKMPLEITKIIGVLLSITHLEQNTKILVYAKNKKGYQNLVILSSLVNLHKQNTILIEDVEKYQEGLIFVTPGYLSDLDQALLNKNKAEAIRIVESYKTHLKDFHLGLMVQTLKMEIEVAPIIKELALSNQLLYLPIHQTLYLASQKQSFLSFIRIENDKNVLFDEGDFSFKTASELEQEFNEYPEVFTHMDQVFKTIHFEPTYPKFILPTPLDKDIDSYTYLKDLCNMGLKLRHQKTPFKNPNSYKQRLDYELEVIHKMGYDNYFLVVWDFVKYAKNQGIMVGPGRGSAAGSLVSFALGITDVDPIQYDLLFERFLNPERISMPDIDLDFPDNKRDMVIDYVVNKYGKHHVVSITTFGTLQLRSSLRDICRTQNLSVAEANRVIKLATDPHLGMDEKTLEIIELARNIEGLPRQTGTHAAGIILSHEDLTKIIPLQTGASNLYQSQFEAADLEAIGLLKIDFLGIRNLAIITDILKIIQTKRGINLDISKIPMHDKKTYDLLSLADTDGVFQLESAGMKRVLQKLKPKDFEDLVALLALFRPGPMENIDTYIERRNGAKFTYIDETLKDILKPTYGIIIYQEQIMKIASSFAGYTLAEADLLRRGVSKKDHKILENERIQFVKKSVLMGKDSTLANTIYDYIVKFADYGFNRSHSVAYAIVAYQMAYLKANYYDVFMTVLMTSISSNTDSIISYIDTLKRKGLKVLKPDVQQSDFEFQLTKEGIIYPLIAIKNIGTTTVNKIKEERNKAPFKDMDDFKKRLGSELNERILEALIFSGALDSFGLNKRTLFESKNTISSEYDLFVSDIVKRSYPEYDTNYLVEKEKQVLGFNLSVSLLEPFQDLILNKHLVTLDSIGNRNKALAQIDKIKVIDTKNNKRMAFITLTDGNYTLEVTVFPETLKQYESLLEVKKMVIAEIEKNDYNGEKFVLLKVEAL